MIYGGLGVSWKGQLKGTSLFFGISNSKPKVLFY